MSLSHPYSGPASYIYASEQSDSEDERSSTIQRGYDLWRKESITEPVRPSPRSTAKKPMSPAATSDRPLASASVPQFSAELQSERYQKLNASSYVRAPHRESRLVREPHVYESMRVRFATPNQHVATWRLQMKAAKKRFGRFRQGVAKLITRNWIVAPHPRLSMVD